ncbi:hypothetical protein AB674_00240 [Flavobacterium sp. ABG]|nr:hypothetical protein AB674_00240 [Flavobacterium sp. ABG]
MINLKRKKAVFIWLKPCLSINLYLQLKLEAIQKQNLNIKFYELSAQDKKNLAYFAVKKLNHKVRKGLCKDLKDLKT